MFIEFTYDVQCEMWNVHICAMWQCRTLIMDVPAIIMVCTHVLLHFHPPFHNFESNFNQFEIVPHLRPLNGQLGPICFLADVHKITSADCKKKSLTRSAFKWEQQDKVNLPMCTLVNFFLSDVRLKVADTSCGLQLILHTDSSSQALALMSK